MPSGGASSIHPVQLCALGDHYAVSFKVVISLRSVPSRVRVRVRAVRAHASSRERASNTSARVSRCTQSRLVM